MRTPDQAAAIAREIVEQKFSGADFAFCAGSIVRGEGTATSDIDLVVIFPKLTQAWRESFVHEEWPVEAFVHDHATLRYFYEDDIKRGAPSLPQMVVEGVLVHGDATLGLRLRQEAANLLRIGPPALSEEEKRDQLYAISDLVDDLLDPRSREELVGTGAKLYGLLADFALRSRGMWSGEGKQIARAMQRQSPPLYREFTQAFDSLFQESNATPVLQLTESLLADSGGLLFGGYKKMALPEWRRD